MGQNINKINSTNPEDIEAVNVLVKEIARAIRENTVNCDHTFKTVVKQVTPKGYVILDESGSERTVGCCIPNITLYAGQMVWVKIPMGDVKGMYICNVVESRRGSSGSNNNPSSNAEKYTGSYTVKPLVSEQTLATKDKVMTDDVTVLEIPYSEVSNNEGGCTVTIG